MRTINQALRESDYRDQFEIEQGWAARYDDLQALLLRHRPTIVHFSGHGTDENQLLLQDEQGDSHPISG